MFNWRNAIGLTVIFGTLAILYFIAWYVFVPAGTDYAGFVMLGLLGVAMGFGFIVLLRSSREL